MEAAFILKFEGLDADDHALDIKRFGEAMVGLDRVVNTGLIAVSDLRVPKRGERFPLRIRAGEPKDGSFEIVGELSQNVVPTLAGALPVVHDLFYNKISELIWHWVSWATNMAGGRQREAEPHFRELMELTKEIHRSKAQESDANRKFTLDVLDRMSPGVRGLVAPVGFSAETLSISQNLDRTDDSTTKIDVPMAMAIRSKEKLEVGDLEEFFVRVDGLIHHNKSLKIQHPDVPGKFLSTSVRDPSFGEGDNVYTRAVAAQGRLRVLAKPLRKQDGTLHTLYILDASEI